MKIRNADRGTREGTRSGTRDPAEHANRNALMWNARLWGPPGTPQLELQDKYWHGYWQYQEVLGGTKISTARAGGQGQFYTQTEPGTREPDQLS